MSQNFIYYGETCRLSDDDNGALGAVINGDRIPISAWRLAQKLHAAGGDGIATGDVSHTDRQILESAGSPPRTDSIGSRLWLNDLPRPSGFIKPVPREAPQRPRQHYSGGAPVGGPEGPAFDRNR